MAAEAQLDVRVLVEEVLDAPGVQMHEDPGQRADARGGKMLVDEGAYAQDRNDEDSTQTGVDGLVAARSRASQPNWASSRRVR